MKAYKLGWKEIGLVALTLVLNAAILTHVFDGSSLDPIGTAFAQPYDNGLPCENSTECISNFCLNGICTTPAQSPVMAVPFQWLAAGLVALIAALRIRRRL
jgi:hypothetical protein